MKYKTGQIIFFNWNNIYSKVIGVFNRLEYGETGFSHVGIITEVLDDKVLIHEALSKGFSASYYSTEHLNQYFAEGSIAIGEAKMPLTYTLEHANNYLGRPYAWFDIISITLAFFTKFKFLKLTGASKLICSEAVARILYDASGKKIDFEEEYGKKYDLITPMDIYRSNQIKLITEASMASDDISKIGLELGN